MANFSLKVYLKQKKYVFAWPPLIKLFQMRQAGDPDLSGEATSLH